MPTRTLLQQQIDFFLRKYFKINHDNGDAPRPTPPLSVPATRIPLGTPCTAGIWPKASRSASRGCHRDLQQQQDDFYSKCFPNYFPNRRHNGDKAQGNSLPRTPHPSSTCRLRLENTRTKHSSFALCRPGIHHLIIITTCIIYLLPLQRGTEYPSHLHHDTLHSTEAQQVWPNQKPPPMVSTSCYGFPGGYKQEVSIIRSNRFH